jgi:hypothetical protein
MKKCIIAAGTKKLIKDGTNRLKNWEKSTTPFCQTISVVISPNGLNGYTALALFALAYVFVMVEEFTHFRKSKPVILVAGVIWGLIGWIYAQHG